MSLKGRLRSSSEGVPSNASHHQSRGQRERDFLFHVNNFSLEHLRGGRPGGFVTVHTAAHACFKFLRPLRKRLCPSPRNKGGITDTLLETSGWGASPPPVTPRDDAARGGTAFRVSTWTPGGRGACPGSPGGEGSPVVTFRLPVSRVRGRADSLLSSGPWKACVNRPRGRLSHFP